MKTEQDYFVQFENTLKVEKARAKREGFEGEDATNLAVTALIASMARSMAEASRFHERRLAFREKEITELRRRNAWQVNRITQLENR